MRNNASIACAGAASARVELIIKERAMSASNVTARPGFLDRERIVALPLHRAIGLTKRIDCPQDLGLLATITSTTCDWQI
jgi:hypothetical protein